LPHFDRVASFAVLSPPRQTNRHPDQQRPHQPDGRHHLVPARQRQQFSFFIKEAQASGLADKAVIWVNVFPLD